MVLSSGRLFSAPVGLLERSWSPTGLNKLMETALGRPEATEEIGFSLPGGPKWGPERGPKRGQKRDPGLERQCLDF